MKFEIPVKSGIYCGYMWASSCPQELQICISSSSVVDFLWSPEILSASRGFVVSPFLPLALLSPPPLHPLLYIICNFDLTGLLRCLLQLTERHQMTVEAAWSVPAITAVCVVPSGSSCSCRGRGYLTMEPVSTPAPLDTTDREGRTSTAAWVRFWQFHLQRSLLILSLTRISAHDSFILRPKLV